jgi:hypothetical protein
MIPRIAHFIWLDFGDEAGNRRAAPPERSLRRVAAFREAHPGWQVKVWDGEGVHALVRRAAPEYYAQRFLAYPAPIMRVDAARYFILHEHGGVYMDMDYLLVRPLDALLEAHRSATSLVYEEETFNGSRAITNSFLVTAPGSPLTAALIEGLRAAEAGPVAAGQPVTLDYVYATTGPAFLAAAVRKLASPVVLLRDEIRNCGCCGEPEVAAARREGGVYLLNENVGTWKGGMASEARRLGCGALGVLGISPRMTTVRRARAAAHWVSVGLLSAAALAALAVVAWAVVARNRNRAQSH